MITEKMTSFAIRENRFRFAKGASPLTNFIKLETRNDVVKKIKNLLYDNNWSKRVPGPDSDGLISNFT